MSQVSPSVWPGSSAGQRNGSIALDPWSRFAILLLALGLFLTALLAEQFNDRQAAETQRQAITDQTIMLRDRLALHLGGDIQLVQGLVALIAAEPELDAARFARAARAVLAGRTRLRNVSAAPDMVIRLIYPLEGNATALGFDLRSRPDQSPAADQASRDRQAVLNGPIQLIQGGCGFAARVPVHVEPPDAGERFWGLVSALIDCEQLYRDSGLLEADLNLEVAIRGRDGDPDSEVFFGRAGIFNEDPILTELPLPQGSWRIAAIPRGGWPAHASNVWSLRLALLLAMLLVLLPVIALARTAGKTRALSRRMAETLSLTEATLEATDNGILVIDLHGRVVSFNRRFIDMWQIPGALLDTGDDETLLAHVIDQLADPEQFMSKVRELYEHPGATSRDTLMFRDGRVFARFSHPQRVGAAVAGRVWSFLDVTDQTRAEQSVRELSRQLSEELERSEQQRHQLQCLLSAIPDAIWMKDPHGVFLSCNPEFARMLGQDSDRVIGTSDDDYFPQEVAETFRADDRRAADSPTPILCEEWIDYVRESRRVLWATVKVAVRAEDGRLLGVLGIARDITSQHAVLAELEDTRNAAVRASAAKSRFLAHMSHELRTPLNAIIGFAQMLDLDAFNPLMPKQREAVGHIQDSGRHLLELINDILDLARIESGQIDLNIETVPLGPMIDEVIALSRPAADSRQIRIDWPRDVGLAPGFYVRADPTRLRQVLLNLLSNAIKYNREGGRVSIGVELDGTRARVSVSDTGAGINESLRHEIFQPFQRLGAEKTATEGTGIGLVICKHLIEAMGGHIDFVSVPGQGSRFWFELRLARPEPAARQPIGNPVQDIGADAQVRGRVLYVEDNPLNMSLMQHLFKRLPGVEFLTAHDAATAMALLTETRPDLVLMDINLPGMSGIEILQWMRDQARLKRIPVIAVSANAMPEAIQSSLAAGFQDYFTKPFDVRRLLVQVRAYLIASGQPD